jgi:hypothetical protein
MVDVEKIATLEAQVASLQSTVTALTYGLGNATSDLATTNADVAAFKGSTDTFYLLCKPPTPFPTSSNTAIARYPS